MFYVVTGAAGFIGSNLVKGLNQQGITDIIAVDNLTKAEKFCNLTDCEIADYFDKTEFLDRLESGEFDGVIEAVLHQGACSDTMEHDGHYMMANNYRYSMSLLNHCVDQEIPLIYASSASVYGGGKAFREDRALESPLNIYGYSKFLFDQVVRRRLGEANSPVVGLRYFNVYGPRERHKGRMASVAFHLFNQYLADGRVRLFEGADGYGNGEQRRDFVFVEDVVKVNFHFLDNQGVSGIFNVGTGRAQTFNDVAVATVNACRNLRSEPHLNLGQMQAKGIIEYIPFPDALRGKYQSFTEADVAALRASGYDGSFHDVDAGVRAYVETLARD